ncbi:MAG: glycosyltransferase family 2 protein [Lachnospiraceae bacterium]|nr:glycosyltransferase family 2 protein [Lachnospiraceae bacterium]
MTPISICIIAKNEEKHMDVFLSSIKKHMENYPHEIVLVDTGSTDKTVAIAKKYTDKVFSFAWINDFSAARNYSLNCATYDWVLVLDCDEYVTQLNPEGFKQFINQYPKGVGMLSRRNHYAMNGTDSVYTDHVERFFDRRQYHYESIIHEQVRRLDGENFERVSIPLVVEHCGYSGTPEEMVKKAKRNNELLLKMLEETPDDPYLYFQIGQSYNSIHDDENACYYYGKGLEYDVDPRAEYVQMMVIGYGYALLHLGRLEDALLFQNIYEDFAFSADFVCLMGLIFLRNGMVLQAMQEFLKATTIEEAHVTGANSFIPTFNMGCINEVLGDIETAVKLYKKCGDFKPALDRLAELEA